MAASFVVVIPGSYNCRLLAFAWIEEMKRPSQEVKQLLRVLGTIQTLAGRAKAGYMNDRTTDRWGKVVPPLEKILDICAEERGKYWPIE